MKNRKSLIAALSGKYSKEGSLVVGRTLCSSCINDYRKNTIITFNPSIPKETIPTFNDILEYGRKPWGYEYVKKLGFNVIGQNADYESFLDPQSGTRP